MENFLPTLALIGIVVVVASLLSGVVERKGVPLVAVFLALGASLGPWGLGVTDVGLQSPALRTLATLGLALVLFSDAVTLDTREVRERSTLARRLLFPGTFIPAVLIGLAAWWLLGVSVPAAAILGAALASTDPVLLRTVLRSGTLPAVPRIALRLETGMNDVVLLPIVVLSMLLLRDAATVTTQELTRHAIGLLLLGPALGAVVGWLGIVALERVRARFGVRRDYESLYALGLAFSGFAAAEVVGGSGFLAAFAAGFMVASQDVELCDCFLEYGEATAEMLLLLTFVAFGMSLIWTGLTVVTWRTLLFAAIALSARTLVLLPLLKRVGLSDRDRRLIALFGPRGLSALLFTLLPVFAGVRGAEYLFAVVSLVVLLSVVVHGGGIAVFMRRTGVGRVQGHAAGLADPEPSVTPLPASATPAPQDAPVQLQRAPPVATLAPARIEIGEVRSMLERGEHPIIADARADRSYRASDLQASGAVRLPPDDPVRAATEQRLSKHGALVVYCA